MVGLAMEIDHQARDGAEDRRRTEPHGEAARQRPGADVDGDVAVEQRRIDPEIHVRGDMVRRMVAQQQQIVRAARDRFGRRRSSVVGVPPFAERGEPFGELAAAEGIVERLVERPRRRDRRARA